MSKIIIASGPVIVEDNKVLLNEHGDTDFFKFPGGRVEDFDLNLVEAATREVKEEMGIDLEIISDKPMMFHTKKGEIDVILVHFLAKRIGEIRPGTDIRTWGWYPLDDLPDKLAPNIRPILQAFKLIP